MKEFSNKTEAELQDLLKQKHSLLEKFRGGVFAGREKNVREGRSIRKDIARILTEFSRRRSAVDTLTKKG